MIMLKGKKAGAMNGAGFLCYDKVMDLMDLLEKSEEGVF